MINQYLRRLDEILAVLGFISSLVLTIWLALTIGHLIYITVGLLSFLACGTYLFLRRIASSSSMRSLALTEARISLYLATNIIFFLLFACSVICFHLRPNLYARPLSYFVALALMTSVIAVEILLQPSRRYSACLTISKIVLISLCLQSSQLFIFPSIAGVDPWFHQMFTLNIVNNGEIPQGYGYSQLPFMHLVIGLTSLITGLGYKIAAMLSISLPQVVLDILVTYLLGNFLFNRKVGLLSSLLLAISNWFIWAGYWPIPNTIAAGFVLLITYLLLRVIREKQNIAVSLAMLFMGALILTHTLTAMWFIILLFTFWAAFKVSNYLYYERKRLVTFTIFILFSVGAFSWWTFASGHITTLAKLIKWGFSSYYFLGPAPEEVAEYPYSVPFSEQLFNQLGMLLFFTMSLIGCLYMISKKFGNSHSFVMAIGGGVTMALSFFPMITGQSIIAERWFYFSQIILALPLAVTFLIFCGVLKNKSVKCLLLASLTFSSSFLMILSPTANLDNPAFSPNTQVRYAFTESELQAVDTLSNMGNRTMGVDSYYSCLKWSKYRVKEIDDQIFTKNYLNCQDMLVLIRKEIIEKPFILFESKYKLDYDPQAVLTSQGFSRVYDCGSVSAFNLGYTISG